MTDDSRYVAVIKNISNVFLINKHLRQLLPCVIFAILIIFALWHNSPKSSYLSTNDTF